MIPPRRRRTKWRVDSCFVPNQLLFPPNLFPKAPAHIPRISFKFSNGDAYLLDVVVGKSASILKLLAGEDQTLLVRGNALLVLDLALNVVNSV